MIDLMSINVCLKLKINVLILITYPSNYIIENREEVVKETIERKINNK
jgi:hypothetical protein